jgi:hypothetical protein
MSHPTLRHFSRLISPTVRDGSLPATPRRIRLHDGETLDHYMGAPYHAMVGGKRLLIQKGFYVGWRTVLTHTHVLTNTYLWVKVEEPFVIQKH